MKKICAFIIFALISVQPVFALLSPLNQSIAEYRAVLASPELNLLLPQDEKINAIIKRNEGYQIRTLSRVLLVDVEYLSTQHPGPQQFKLHFHDPIQLLEGNK